MNLSEFELCSLITTWSCVSLLSRFMVVTIDGVWIGEWIY
jgi:hypothetical protein